RGGEVRVVGLDPAADVEHAEAGRAPPLRLEPARERLAHRPAREALAGVPPVLAGPGAGGAHSSPPTVAARPKPSQVTACSGIPATIPSPTQVPVAARSWIQKLCTPHGCAGEG